MDYNQLITTELPKVLKRITKMVDRFSEDHKIEDIKVTVDDTDIADLGTYVATHTTCEYIFTVSYKLDTEDEWREFYVSVPRMIGGIFIIDGKYKMLSRYITEDNMCRWWGKWFRIQYGLSWNSETQVFDVKDEDGDSVEMTYQQVKDTYPEKLLLDDHCSAKLKIRLNLNYFPKSITEELMQKIINTPMDPRDILDKRISSIETVILSSLNHSALDICRELTHNFYSKGTISHYPFEKIIRAAFNGQDDMTNTIVTATNVNPISFDSANDKIIIDHSSEDENLMPGQYDISMADIIDPLVTPDNANINKLNHLTKAANISGQYIAIDCYDKNFNPVSVDYVKYLASTILISDEVKSYQDRIIPKKGKYRVKINRIEKESDSFDYIEPSPDDRLSVESRMIPMVNLVDSVRGSMGSKMVSQAVPLCHPEKARVLSGYESDNSLSTTDIKFGGSNEGEVIKADSKSVIVMSNDIPHEYKIPTPTVGIYDVTAVFAPAVKVGQRVKFGDTLISHDVAKTGTRELGCNALVALRPYRGYNYEDGIVISQSFARKMSHYSIIDLTLYVKDGQSLQEMLPIGSRVRSKDVLVKCATAFRNSSLEGLVSLVGDDKSKITQRNDLITPNNIDDAIVTDVKIQYNDYVESRYGKEVNVLDENSIKLINKFKKQVVVLPDSIPDSYRAQLPGAIEYEGYSACIRYRLLNYSPAIVGSKLCNRYGSKGLVALVVPDEEMDRTEDGREIDVILNSDAVIARKNIAQIPEVYLSVIADKVKENIKNLSLEEARVILNQYKLDNYSRLSDDELMTAIKSSTPFNYITGCFSRISPDEVLKWSDKLGATPMTRIIDGKTKRKVKNRILVGSMYMMKLYQLPEYYNKVYTADSDSDPVLGKGLHRDDAGMAQGALETFSLLASDLEPYIQATRHKTQFIDAQGILINLRLAGVDMKIENDEENK